MGKNPAFLFYPADWRRDPQLQMSSLSTRGTWIEMMCCMWYAPSRGELSGSMQSLSRMIGCSVDELANAIVELRDLGVADVTMSENVPDCHSYVTVICRRMRREEKAKNNSKLRKRKQRESQRCPADVANAYTVAVAVPPTGGTPPTPADGHESAANDLPDFAVAVPDYVPYEIWRRYKHWRSTVKRRPVPPEEEQLAFQQLLKLADSGQDLESVILQSMVSDWARGFYPVRGLASAGQGGCAGGKPYVATFRDAEKLAGEEMARRLLAKKRNTGNSADGIEETFIENGGGGRDGGLESQVSATAHAVGTRTAVRRILGGPG